MSDETALITTTHLIDSLSANEFAVEIDGERAASILRVAGLRSFKLEVKPGQTKLQREPIKISKMVQHDVNAPFNRWIRETLAAREDIVRPKRTIAIVALDEGIETRRWTLKNAWIAEIGYSDFDMTKSDLVEETFTIHFEEIDETWSASPSP